MRKLTFTGKAIRHSTLIKSLHPNSPYFLEKMTEISPNNTTIQRIQICSSNVDQQMNNISLSLVMTTKKKIAKKISLKFIKY